MTTSLEFENDARRFPQYYSESPTPPLLEQYLRSASFESFLDCGCGDGDLVRSLGYAGLLEKKKVFAVDLSQTRIERVRAAVPWIHASVDSAETLRTIEDKSIDFFTSTQVIEHVDDRAMLASIARVTRPGATVYLTTVWKKWYSWYFFRNNTGNWVLDPTHIREYRSDAELLDLVDPKIFYVLENVKVPVTYPIMDFLVRRAGITNGRIFENRAMNAARKIKIPIVGFYIWELVLRRRA